MFKLLFIKYLFRKLLFITAAGLISILTVVGLDFTTYSQLTSQEAIVRVTVAGIDNDSYQIKVVSEKINEQFILQGDEWQMDFRLIRFSPIVAMTGVSYLYQPFRLSNRYLSLKDQRSKPLYFFSLRDTRPVNLDLWNYFKNYSNLLPLIDTTFGSSVFMPLSDNAEYDILIGFSGLVVKAANEDGRLAIQNWQLN